MEYESNIRRLIGKLNRIKNDKADLTARLSIKSITYNSDGGHSSLTRDQKLARYTDRMAQLDKEEAMVEQLLDEEKKRLDLLETPLAEIVNMRLFSAKPKNRKWERIAIKVGYSERQTQRLYYRAMNILNGGNKNE